MQIFRIAGDVGCSIPMPNAELDDRVVFDASGLDWQGDWGGAQYHLEAVDEEIGAGPSPDVVAAGPSFLCSEAVFLQLVARHLLLDVQGFPMSCDGQTWRLVRVPARHVVDLEGSEFVLSGGRRALLTGWRPGPERAALFKVPGIASRVYCTDEFTELVLKMGWRGLTFTEVARLDV
jgi:hypothetical protein